jgi:hypothetical protein
MKKTLLALLFVFIEICYDVSLGAWFFYVLEEPIKFLTIRFFVHMVIFALILTLNDKIIHSIRSLHDKFDVKPLKK